MLCAIICKGLQLFAPLIISPRAAELRVTIAAAGAIDPLVSMLLSTTDSAREHAIGALHNLACGNGASRCLYVSERSASSSAHHTVPIFYHCCWVGSGTCAETRFQIRLKCLNGACAASNNDRCRTAAANTANILRLNALPLLEVLLLSSNATEKSNAARTVALLRRV